MRLVDAHNHLQDERFAGRQASLIAACREAGVVRMVVNGSSESDWDQVAALARRYPDLVRPAFGLHPWSVRGRSRSWLDALRRHLDSSPGASVGEIGLDRWILDAPTAARAAVAPDLAALEAASLAEQEEVFGIQLALAAERGIPASLHCLQAWGPMVEHLRRARRPECGILLHSYGGSAELITPLARLGAYFSFPGYYLHPRKARQREAFRQVPPERLLAETDAPDQRLPAETPGAGAADEALGLADLEGRPLNHPANLRRVYLGLAAVLGEAPGDVAARIETNFARLFGDGPVLVEPGATSIGSAAVHDEHPVPPEAHRSRSPRGSGPDAGP